MQEPESPTRKRVFLTIVGVLLTVIAIYASRPPQETAFVPESPVLPSVSPSALPSAAASPPPSVSSPARDERANPEELWKKFSARFGDHLLPRFDRAGRLVSVRGRPGEGKSVKGFEPKDPQKASARAREVIAAASGLLGLNPEFPLGDARARGTAASAQVFFQQSKDGVLLAPVGSVMVDLGQDGELLGLDSDYAPEVRVVNEKKITSDEAKNAAVASMKDDPSLLRTVESGPVIWVSRPVPGQAAEGRNAYRFNVKGRDIIVDASSGAILHERDQRRQ